MTLPGKKLECYWMNSKMQGRYDINFDGSNLSSGIYFYKIESGEFSSIRKMILLK